MNSGKNGKHYLGKPLFCAKEIPKTEGMGICLGLELMLYFLTCNRVPKWIQYLQAIETVEPGLSFKIKTDNGYLKNKFDEF